MREILFKGKRIDTEEWAFGSLLIDGEAHKTGSKENFSFSKHYIVPETDAENIQTRFSDGSFYLNTVAYHIIQETACQFTGFIDKNKKQIFESDIVKVDGKLYEVKYMLGQFYIGINMPIAYKRFDCEVVGNVFDNPEFLK